MQSVMIESSTGELAGRVGVWAAMALVTGIGAVPVSAQLKGEVRLDGSSTVAPITMAAAEMFGDAQPGVRVTVGISGTGGGFKKFLDENPALRTDISDASRPIKPSELKRAKKYGIEFVEVPIGLDGISVMVHPSNTFCDSLTVAELKKIWEPGSAITNWSQVRAGFPDLPLALFAPGTDSGTFDYFTETIVGEAQASRSDYSASVTPNVLVRGIAGNRGSLGYFGFSYYENNRDKLKLVGVDNNKGKAIKPTLQLIRSGAYKPLSRPLFLYVNKKAYKRPAVRAFVDFVLDNARKIVEHPRVGYVGLSDELYQIDKNRLATGKTGSAMAEAGESRDLRAIFGGR